MPSPKKFNIKIILSFAAVYIIWGTTYLAIKIGIADMPPFFMAMWRYLIAGVLLLGYSMARKQHIFKTEVLRNFLLGCFMLTFGQAVLFWAELYVPSGLAAVLNASLPIWFIVVDRANWKTNLKNQRIIWGILIGLAGIVLLFKDQSLTGGGASGNLVIIASLIIIASCICWAIGSLYYKHHRKEENLTADVGWQLLGGMVSCFVITLFRGELNGFHFSQVSTNTWLAILYLAIAGSVLTFLALYYLLSVRPASIVGTYAYINPVVAVFLGWAMANESISKWQLAGIAVILFSAWLVNSSKLKEGK